MSRGVIIAILLFLFIALFTIGIVAVRIYIKKKQEELNEAEKKKLAEDYAKGYENAALNRSENDAEAESTEANESEETTEDTKTEDTTTESIKPTTPTKPCDKYIDSSTNLNISCMQQIWKDAGCTNTDHIFDTDWYKIQDMKTIKEDSKQWATLDDDFHKKGCYGDKTTLGGKILNELTSTNTITAIAIGIAMEYAIRKIKIKALARVGFKLQQKGLMITAKVVKNVGQKLGIKALQKLGIRAGEKAAIKAGATVGAKAGAKLATSTAAAASTGPGFPFVAAALFAFDILSLGLDLGDAGGYNKMSTVESYLEIQKTIDQEMKKAFQDAGSEWPAVIGPLDSMTEDELMKQMSEIIGKIMEYNPDKPENSDPLVRPMNEKLILDLKNGTLKDTDLENDNIMDKYFSMIDMDKVYNKAFATLCTSKNGKIIDNTKCSYKDKKSCDASYTWPPGDDQTYAEYKSNVLGGACIVASGAIRNMCNENNIGYNTETGLCDINENYCKRKGADWKYNSKIKQNDCMINDAQNVAENIFGTTITRGLKQIFDPAQYENCNRDEIDDGYFCRSTGCGEDQEKDIAGGVCHEKCKPNYTSDGITICYENCPRYGEMKVRDKCVTLPNGETNNGTTLAMWDCNIPTSQQFYFNGHNSTIKPLKNTSKCIDIPNGNATSNQKLQLWDCNDTIAQKFTYDSKKRFVSQKNKNLCIDFAGDKISNGSLLQLKECNDTADQVFNMEQTTNLLATCTKSTPSRVADCPPGYTNTGATCFRPDHTYYIGSSLVDCPPGYYNNGTSCWRDYTSFTRDSFDNVFKDGKGNCERQYGKGNCSPDGIKARYYPSCTAEAKYLNKTFADDYESGGVFCALFAKSASYGDVGTCPSGKHRGSGITASRCYDYCKDGYTWTGEYCERYADTKGMGSMKCNEGETLRGARCYPNTFPEFTHMGEYASYNKSQYNRGVGSPSVKIRAKKRIVDYSTKDN